MTATSTRTSAKIAEFRRDNGEFGLQPHGEAGIVPVGTDPKLRDYSVPVDRHDLDNIADGLMSTSVAYDLDGYAQVNVEVITKVGELDRHARDYFLGYGSVSGDDMLPSGITKAQTIKEWMLRNDAYTRLNAKVAERYGCDVFGKATDPSRMFSWDATEPGVLADDEIRDVAASVTARFRAESDPGHGADPLGTDDPYIEWLWDLDSEDRDPIAATWAPILTDAQLSKAKTLTDLKADGEKLLKTSMALTSWTGNQPMHNVDGLRLEAMLDGDDGERVLLTSRAMITPMIDEPGFLVRRMTNAVRLDDLSQMPVSYPMSSSEMVLPDRDAAQSYAGWANTKGLIEARPEGLS